uniref:Cyclin-like f-box protein n=1 Tax=Colletotrichum fructicola (strain Nara gc5) TaxID=1213859 RepID=L2GET6_COLFN
MLTVRSPVAALALVLSFLSLTDAAPQNRGKGNGRGNGNRQTAQQQAARVPQGISRATDGSMILDMTANVNGLDLRFKISGPAEQFTAASGVPGAAAQPGAQGTLGLNVLLHGDGGQSFFDMPNQGVQQNLAGVAVLAPDPNLFWGGGQGLQRTDGVAHSQASNVFFTGVSGGSLMLSGFFMPAHMQNFAGNGVLLNCGGLEPQVNVQDPAAIANTRIHFQSTKQELSSLQQSIPAAIKAYEQIGTSSGLNAQALNAKQTVNNSPNGGHCAFDEQGFVSGIQLVADNYATIMQGGTGDVNGIGNVLTGVAGNENLQFTGSSRRRDEIIG